MELTPEERAVWLRQGPHAQAAGTLTAASVVSFRRYCAAVVTETAFWSTARVGGADHRGLLKQINAYELQFCLVPNRKPMRDAPTPEPSGKLGRFRRGDRSA
jgi:hypothetical protein